MSVWTRTLWPLLLGTWVGLGCAALGKAERAAVKDPGKVASAAVVSAGLACQGYRLAVALGQIPGSAQAEADCSRLDDRGPAFEQAPSPADGAGGR